MSVRFIGLNGKKRSGKGATSDILCRDFGFKNVKMSGPLKDMCRTYLWNCGLEESVIERCIEGDLKETPLVELGGKSPRFMMQHLGTAYRLLYTPDLWVRMVSNRVRSYLNQGVSVVMDDLRFPEEIEGFRNIGLDIELYEITTNRVFVEGAYTSADVESTTILPDTDDVFSDVLDSALVYLGLDCSHKGPVFKDLPHVTVKSLKHGLETVFMDGLRRPEIVNTQTTAQHVSEAGFKPEFFTGVIENNGTMDDLKQSVTDVIMPSAVLRPS